jgi:hypothetical protein
LSISTFDSVSDIRRNGWGTEYPESKRNGEWEYQAFLPDGRVDDKVISMSILRHEEVGPETRNAYLKLATERRRQNGEELEANGNGSIDPSEADDAEAESGVGDVGPAQKLVERLRAERHGGLLTVHDDESRPPAYQHQAAAGLTSKLPNRFDLTSHAHQRILRRLISVRGRVGRRALDMRIIVRRAGTEVDDLDAQALA